MQGVSCFSGATFDCTSSFENWQMVLKEEGQRVCPGRNPDTMIFHRVHMAIEEVCPSFEPAVKHFILADTEEQEHTRTVVFAIFTSRFEFFGACHWTPTTRVWDILDLCGGESGWVIYQDEHMTTDIAQGWVANSPSPLPGDVADSAPVVPTVSVDARIMIPLLLSKLLGIRYSSLEDGVVAASRMIGLSLLIWMLFSKQVLSIHLPRHSRQKSRQKRGFAALFNTLFHKGASFSCLSVHCIDIVYLLTMHAAGYMHSSFLMLFSYLTLA